MCVNIGFIANAYHEKDFDDVLLTLCRRNIAVIVVILTETSNAFCHRALLHNRDQETIEAKILYNHYYAA